MSYQGKLLLQLVVVKNAINIPVFHCGIWVAYRSLSYPPG